MERKAFMNAVEISGIKNYKLISEGVAIGLDYGSFKKI
jgi:molecular chaperone DnaK (HSP70)